MSEPKYSRGEKRERIVENKCGRFELEAAVLPLVDPVLLIVPLKPRRYTRCINTPHVADRPGLVRAHPLKSRNALLAP
jgi:hypothetical protein